MLDAIGSRTLWVGAAGQGTRLKLVANSWVLTVLEGIAEALTFAKALGLEPEQFLDAVKGGAMDAPYVQLKGNAMLNGAFDPAFALDGAAKDAGLILDAARAAARRRCARPAPIAGGTAQRLPRSRAPSDAGHGDEDMAAIVTCAPLRLRTRCPRAVIRGRFLAPQSGPRFADSQRSNPLVTPGSPVLASA